MTSWESRSSRLYAVALFAIVASCIGHTAVAQETGEAESRLAVVTADDVLVRSGPADSYYPFGKLRRGDVVKVIGEKYSWARLQTAGPAFQSFFGYIREPKGDSSRLRIEDDGRHLRTLGRADILAPNLNTDFQPRDSWKRILQVVPDTQLRVLDVLDAERETVYKVALPTEAEGWVSTSLLRDATDSQIAAWKRATLGGSAKQGDEAPSLASGRTEANRPVRIGGDGDPAGAVDAPAPVTPRQEELLPEDAAPLPLPPVTEETAADGEAEPAIDGEQISAAGELQESKAPLTAEEVARQQLEKLESAYEQLQSEPIETAEVLPLRDLYLQLAEEEAEFPAVSRYAEARAEQMEIWAELQERRQELLQLRRRIESTSDEVEAFRVALDTTGPYAGVGKLAASTIYDGVRLPKLFRLQDPGSGRTIAYLRPNDELRLPDYLGQLVGIIGDKDYEGSLRLNVIRPRRIDLLAPQG